MTHLSIAAWLALPVVVAILVGLALTGHLGH
jgi:hypothetical protein